MNILRLALVRGAVPPPAATPVSEAPGRDGFVDLTWSFLIDLERGLQAFPIPQDGRDRMRMPAKPVGRFGRPRPPGGSSPDIPETGVLPEGRARYASDRTEDEDRGGLVVNGVGLRREPSNPFFLKR